MNNITNRRIFIYSQTLLVLLLILILISCASSKKMGQNQYKDYYLNDTLTTNEVKQAIQNGIVIEGMCPFQAFAAAGLPGPYMVKADTTKWDKGTPPPVIIQAQCSNPDESIIELMFCNSTQFGGTKEEVFRVRFSRGKAVLIDKKQFNE